MASSLGILPRSCRLDTSRSCDSLPVSCISLIASPARKNGTLKLPRKSSRAVTSLNQPISLNIAPDATLQQRFSFSQITTCGSSCEDDLSGIAKSDLAAIGMWTNKIAGLESGALTEKLSQSGLAVSSLSFIGGFTGSLGMTYREAMEEAYQTLFQAASLGARSVVVATGSRGTCYTEKHERKVVCLAIRELAFVADMLDINLAILPMRKELSKPWTYLDSLAAALELADATQHERVGIVLDAFHFLDDQCLANIPEIVGNIAHVQLSDRLADSVGDESRLLPGDGDLPLVELVSTLHHSGYRGYFDIQVWGKVVWRMEPSEVIQRCDDWVRSLSGIEVGPTDSVLA